jgi:hypothetical protein
MTARMELLAWEAIGKGALVGKVSIRLPIGLEVSGVAIFAKDGRRWAQWPSEMLRDYTGQPLKDERGKTRYRSAIRWASKELQDGFSAALISLVEAEHGPLGVGAP